MTMRRLLAALLVAALAPAVALAAVATSSNYALERDAFGAGGGQGTSTNYVTESSVGLQGIGLATSSSYALRQGYQQLDVDASISVSSPSDLALSSLPGLGGGEVDGLVTWTVTTDSSAGYAAYVRASTDPALTGSGGAAFANYAPAGADPDYVFAVGASEAVFAVSAEGSEVTQFWKDDGASCNAGSAETDDRCYDALTTADVAVAERGTPNAPGGSTVGLRAKAGIGASKVQDSGSYAATVTFTAYAL